MQAQCEQGTGQLHRDWYRRSLLQQCNQACLLNLHRHECSGNHEETKSLDGCLRRLVRQPRLHTHRNYARRVTHRRLPSTCKLGLEQLQTHQALVDQPVRGQRAHGPDQNLHQRPPTHFRTPPQQGNGFFQRHGFLRYWCISWKVYLL